jgi:hypothetical protein
MNRTPMKMPTSSLPVGVQRQKALSGNFVHSFVEVSERPLFHKGSEHYHWTVNAFVWFDEETGAINDSVTISVEAQDEQEAIMKAMAIVERPVYRITSVTEACSWDERH